MKTAAIKRAVWIVDLLLIALLAFVGFRAFGSQPGAPKHGLAAPAPAAAKNSIHTSPGELETARNSGTIVPAPKKDAAVVDNPQTNVDFTSQVGQKLIGIAVNSAAAFAFFEDASRQQTLRSVGDVIGGVTITGILPDRVLVAQGSRTGFILPMKGALDSQQPESAAVVATQQVASAQPSPAREPRPAPAYFPVRDPQLRIEDDPNSGRVFPPMMQLQASPEAADEQPEAPDEDEEPTIDTFVMSEKEYRDYLQNVGKYISQLVILSHQGEDGKLDGLLLQKVPTSSEAFKRGLRSGDVVKKIGNTPITDTSVGYQAAWNVLKNQEYMVDVVVRRKGKEETLSYEVWPE